AYLLRPPSVNPWADRLFAWWLCPLDNPTSALGETGLTVGTDELTASTPTQLAAALSAAPLDHQPVFTTGYLGRSGERFVLGQRFPSRLGTAIAESPANGVATDWGDVFRRFPLPAPG